MDDKAASTSTQTIAETLGLDTAPHKPKRLPWLLAAAAILAAGFYLLFGRAPAPAFETAPVTRGALVVQVTATGTLEPLNKVDVGAEISGRIVRVPVDFNDPVKTGDVLAVIDTTELEAAIVEGEATLESARATLAQAQATAVEQRAKTERTARLAKAGNVSKQELDIAQAALTRAEAAVDQAQAQVRVAEARLNIGRTNLERAHVRSPINGIVLDRKVEPGQTIAATFQTPVLFTLAEDLSKMRLHVDVDEADVGQVRNGQPARFTVDAYPGRVFAAKVLSVRNAPKTDQGVVTYEAVLSVDNGDLALKPGMTATAEIVTASLPDALLVQNGALRFTPPQVKAETLAPGSTVWTLVRGKPKAHMLKLGPSDGTRTQILEGDLKAGDQVLIDVKRKQSAKKRSP